MLAHIDSKGDFFLGARIALQLGPLEPRAGELSDARSRLAKRGLTLWAVLTEVPTVARSAKRLGLATILPAPLDAPNDGELAGSDATLVRGTLHSGERIQSAGHVVIWVTSTRVRRSSPQATSSCGAPCTERRMPAPAATRSAVVCALDLALPTPRDRWSRVR
jgi:hypothetical protein